MNSFKFINIKQWWLRLAFLLIVGIPILTGWPISILSTHLNSSSTLSTGASELFAWSIYALLVWFIVLFNAGIKKGKAYLIAALILGFTTATIGVALRLLFPILAAGLSNIETVFKMLKIMVTICIVVPYSLLFLNCFSAKGVIENVSSWTGIMRIPGLHFALSLRVFQHAGEVVFNLTDFWLEEFPTKWQPFHQIRWKNPIIRIVTFPIWIVQSLSTWMFACIVNTFEPIPVMVSEVEAVSLQKSSNSKVRWSFAKTGIVTALTALATISTIFIKIPIPATGGYFNIGDTFVILAGLWLGPIAGFLVGAIGPTLADAIGYPAYIPATFIIKGFEGLIVGIISGGISVNSDVRKIVASLVGAIIIIVGYFIFEAYIYPEMGKYIPAFAITDIGAALVALIPNSIQGIVCAIGGFALWKAVAVRK